MYEGDIISKSPIITKKVTKQKITQPRTFGVFFKVSSLAKKKEFFGGEIFFNPFRNFLTGPEYRNSKFVLKGPDCPTLNIMKRD